MKKISVIIPIYNTKEYLEHCLNSVISQTYENIEILCIDDGSTDGSGKIVDDFAERDRRIISVHQVNQGESRARNVGLQMASGKYIAFCDCDDWLDPDMYENLVEYFAQGEVDVVASSWYKETDYSSQKIRNQLEVRRDVFGREDFLRYLYMRDSYRGFAYMWNKLYTREVLKDTRGRSIFFNEKLALGGDVLFLAEVALNVNRVKYIDQAYYHYRQRENSGCHTKNIEKLRDWIRAYEIILQRFSEEQVDNEIIKYVERFLAYHSSNAAEIALEQGNEMAGKEFQSIMKKYEKIYMELNLQYPERVQRYDQILTKKAL